jgi:hypothetical protein
VAGAGGDALRDFARLAPTPPQHHSQEGRAQQRECASCVRVAQTAAILPPQRVGIDGRPAHGAGFNAAAAGFGLGKRRVSRASFFSVFWPTVGWFSLNQLILLNLLEIAAIRYE